MRVCGSLRPGPELTQMPTITGLCMRWQAPTRGKRQRQWLMWFTTLHSTSVSTGMSARITLESSLILSWPQK